MNETKNIGIWLRVSNEAQVESESPEVHLKRAEEYANRKKWNVVKVYRLDAVSGKSVINHHQAQEMLRDVENGVITALVFSKLARLARNTSELLQFSEHFQKYNADLVSLFEAIDTSSPAGRLYFSILASMATWEREEISSRVAASVPVRAKMNKPLGGQASYGFKWVDQKLEIDSQEAPIRKLMFELFLTNKRFKTVARLLNEKGHRTRNGAMFSGTTVRRLLQDPIAKGLRRSNYTQSLGEGKHWKLKPQDEWVFTEAPIIVSEELWDKVNGVIDAQLKTRSKPTKLNTHMFGGIAICDCGGKMYVPTNSLKYVCKDCKRKIPKDDLETLYYQALKLELTSEATYTKAQEDKQKQLNDMRLQVSVLERREKQLQEEIQSLFELHRLKQLKTEDFSSYYQPKKDEQEQVAQELQELNYNIDYLSIHTSDLLEVLETAVYLRDNWENIAFEEKRDLVRRCTHTITIGEHDITISLIQDEHHSYKSMTKGEHKVKGSLNSPT